VYKFAHFSDAHIGVFRDPILKNLVLDAFNQAIDICIERQVDFVIFSGDLFDANIPDLEKATQAVARLKELRDNGIAIYVVYGSHDFSPTQKSVIDLLEKAGLFVKVTKGQTLENGKIRLEFVKDPKTGAKLVGIDGRKLGIDKEYFEVLDREALEKEDGFKIFVFHGALSEYKPATISEADSMPVSNVPAGFDYYAAGHLHERTEGKIAGYDYVLYPGTLFGGDYGDLEKNARGEERGFYTVSFDTKVREVEFIPISPCGYALIEYDANGKTAKRTEEELVDRAKACDVKGQIVIVKVRGELSTGKTSDIDFTRVRKILEEQEAKHISINRAGLTSREYTSIRVSGEDIRQVETKLFRESIGQLKISDQRLKGEAGVQLSVKLLAVLRQSKKENESKTEYDSRILSDGSNVLGLREVIK